MPFLKKAKKPTHDQIQGPDVSILEIEKAFDARTEQRQAEHVRVVYSMGETEGETQASITWEALAQLRQEMERGGKAISERGVLDFVLLPWMMEQLKRSHNASEEPPADGYRLDFGAAPKRSEVRSTLVRYGLLPA